MVFSIFGICFSCIFFTFQAADWELDLFITIFIGSVLVYLALVGLRLYDMMFNLAVFVVVLARVCCMVLVPS